MKLSKRIKYAINIIRNKSSSGGNDDFFTSLGLRDVPEEALSEATYFACMKVLCEAIGKLPLKLLQYGRE